MTSTHQSYELWPQFQLSSQFFLYFRVSALFNCFSLTTACWPDVVKAAIGSLTMQNTFRHYLCCLLSLHWAPPTKNPSLKSSREIKLPCNTSYLIGPVFCRANPTKTLILLAKDALPAICNPKRPQHCLTAAWEDDPNIFSTASATFCFSEGQGTVKDVTFYARIILLLHCHNVL